MHTTKGRTLKQRRYENEVTEELNRSLGCIGKLNRIGGGRHTAMLTWFAEAGEVLKWKDDSTSKLAAKYADFS